MKIKQVLIALVVMVALALPAMAETVHYIDKAVPTEYGVYCSFWRITMIKIKTVEGDATVFLQGWLDADAFVAGKQSMENKTVVAKDVDEATVDTGDGGIKNLYDLVAGKVYELVLETPTFDGGVIKTIEIPLK